MRKDKNEKQAENETQALAAGQDLDEKNLDEKNQNTATKEDEVNSTSRWRTGTAWPLA